MWSTKYQQGERELSNAVDWRYTANNIIKITRIQQTVKYGSAQGKTQSGNKDLKEESVNKCVCEDDDVAVRPTGRAPVYLTSGLVLSSSPHWCALYFFTSAMYLVQASPFPASACVKHTHTDQWTHENYTHTHHSYATT